MILFSAKKVFLSSAIFIIACLFGCASAPKLVQTADDMIKIKDNKAMFIGKPLKKVLREIKPKIVSVSATTSIAHAPRGIGYFTFRFFSQAQSDSLIKIGKPQYGITIYVQGPFEWSFEERGKKNFLIWSKKDLRRYGNLIVKAFRG